MTAIAERFSGCLLAGAIGDAMGAPVEFMSSVEIDSLTHGEGVNQFYPAYGKLGAITDDTQMTLFTCEALLQASNDENCSSEQVISYFNQAYLHWLNTQQEASPLPLTYTSHLLNVPSLNARREPGITCITSLRNKPSLQALAENESKGCGGVMRAAPVGLFAVRKALSDEVTFRLGAQCAHVTHGHPTGYLSAGLFAVIIRCLIQGMTLRAAIDVGLQELQRHNGHEETLLSVQRALMLSATGLSHRQAIQMLGEGWVAEEALAIALYCVLVAKDFSQLINYSVSHGGDSDSTGSIAGNLWGAMHGLNGIPQPWLAQLEAHQCINQMALALFDCA